MEKPLAPIVHRGTDTALVDIIMPQRSRPGGGNANR